MSRPIALRGRRYDASPFPLPSRPARLAIGYHWSDPERTGSWQSVIWDDGRYGYLPEALPPGSIGLVEMEIMPPNQPGDRWLLTLVPLLITGEQRQWGPSPLALLEWVEVEP